MKDFKFNLEKMIVFENKIRPLIVEIRFNDKCQNGHQTFAITGQVGAGPNPEICGCIHDEITEHYPNLEPFIKWHLTSTDGPVHYIANSLYHAENGNLEYACSSAVWPSAQLADFTKQNLESRLSELLCDFMADMEKIQYFQGEN